MGSVGFVNLYVRSVERVIGNITPKKRLLSDIKVYRRLLMWDKTVPNPCWDFDVKVSSSSKLLGSARNSVYDH